MSVIMLGLATISTSGSIALTGTTLSFVNDSDSPGNGYYYGTNSSGTKGWFTIPATGVTTVAGTAGQVLVNGGTAGATGAVTLTLATALVSINSITSTSGQALVLATGTAGTAISVASATKITTFSAGIVGTSLTLSSLTSGRVPFASTAGLLTDSSSLTWDGVRFDIRSPGGDVAGANIFIGNGAGNATLTNYSHIFIGYNSGALVTDALSSVGIGRETLSVMKGGGDHVAIGWRAMQLMTYGNDNTGVGLGALQLATVTGYNTALGNFALNGLTTGNPTATTAGSFVIGSDYAIVTVGSTDFTLIGAASNTIGVSFRATGAGTGTGTAAPAQTGQNVGVGNNVANLWNGDSSIYIGAFGARYLKSGNRNTMVGTAALGQNLTPFALDNSVVIGYAAGSLVTSGNTGLTLVGTGADVTGGTASNSTALGNGALVTASNQVSLGNSSVTALKLAGTTFATVSGGAITATPSAISGVQTITGTAGDMTILAGTGNNRSVIIQSTGGSGAAVTALTTLATGGVTFPAAITYAITAPSGGISVSGDVASSAGNLALATTAGKGVFWGANDGIIWRSAGNVRFSGGTTNMFFELLGDSTHDGTLLVSGGSTTNYIGTVGTAGNIITGSQKGALNIRTGSKNFELSTDNGNTIHFSIAATTGNVAAASTTEASALGTAALVVSGGVSVAKSLIIAGGQGWGGASVVTANSTTTLTAASASAQIFTGSVSQTVQLPAANAMGANIAITYMIVNRSTAGTLFLTRAGSDNIEGGATYNVPPGGRVVIMSDGSSFWAILG